MFEEKVVDLTEIHILCRIYFLPTSDAFRENRKNMK